MQNRFTSVVKSVTTMYIFSNITRMLINNSGYTILKSEAAINFIKNAAFSFETQHTLYTIYVEHRLKV